MRSTRFLAALLAVIALATFAATRSDASGESPTPAAGGADQIGADLRELCRLRPQSGMNSGEEQKRLKAIVDRLAHANPREVVIGIVESLRHGKRNREIPAYREVLPEIPSLKQEMLTEIRLQSNATIKGGLINCMSGVKGADVLRALIPPLEDRRQVHDGGPSQTRVCDSAFNVIYLRVAHIRELGFDNSSDMLDAIHPDVPVEWRDARIAKLKAALTAMFGPDLRFPDDL